VIEPLKGIKIDKYTIQIVFDSYIEFDCSNH